MLPVLWAMCWLCLMGIIILFLLLWYICDIYLNGQNSSISKLKVKLSGSWVLSLGAFIVLVSSSDFLSFILFNIIIQRQCIKIVWYDAKIY